MMFIAVDRVVKMLQIDNKHPRAGGRISRVTTRNHLEILGPVDTAFYYVDRPETPMNLGALTVFQGKIEFEDFLKTVEARIYRAPIYQQRVVQAPLNLGQPSWVFDPHFDVSHHVFGVDLPKPGTEEQLRELSGELISGMLDRSKPLWEIYLISGLEHDRTAILFKVHHCLVDGLSAVELFTMLMDIDPNAPEVEHRVIYTPRQLPTSSDLISRAISADLPHRWGLLKKIGGDASRLSSILLDKEKRRQTFVGIANLLNDNLSRIKPLPINGKNTGSMTLAWAEFSLEEVQAIHHKQKASVNEVMLAVLGGAVDRYVRDYPTFVDCPVMRVIVPVSLRQENEKHDFGNRLSVLPMDIALNVSGPLERLRKVVEYSQIMKQSSLTIGLDIVLTLPSLYPSFAQPLVWEIAPKAFSLLAHSWCTNVAGPPLPVYVQGHEMLHSYGYFPINPSMGLATVILSYNGRITMTLVADQGIVPDVLQLRDYLHESFVELRRAAGVPEIPLKRDEPAPMPQATVKASAQPSAPVVPARAVPTPAAVSETPVPEPPAPVAVVDPPPAPVSEAVSETTPATSEAVSETTLVIAAEPALVDEAPVPPAESPSNSTNGASGANGKVDEPVAVTELESLTAPMFVMSVGNGNGSHAEAALASPLVAPAPVADHPVEVAPVVDVQSPAPEAAPAEAIQEEPEEAPEQTPSAPQPPKLFSEDWAQAYQQAINSSPSYKSASLRWEAGQLAFVIHASPRHNLFAPTAVLLDLHRGDCRAAHNAPVELAVSKASFVIEGEYDNWLKVLNGEADAIKMLMRGGLRLRKGSMLRLMPFTQSAQELVRSAQRIT